MTDAQKISEIKKVLDYRDKAFDGQEFGASYAELDNVIERIRDITGATKKLTAEETIMEKTTSRDDMLKNVINNLLNEICTKTDIPEQQYEDWLRLEVGMPDDLIDELKNEGLFPQPEAMEHDL